MGLAGREDWCKSGVVPALEVDACRARHHSGHPSGKVSMALADSTHGARWLAKPLLAQRVDVQAATAQSRGQGWCTAQAQLAGFAIDHDELEIGRSSR
jgi:hypothetical protein